MYSSFSQTHSLRSSVSSSWPPHSSLSRPQLVLFEECTLDDDGAKCKELDSALTAFETALATQLSADATKTKANLEKSKKNRAAARVKAAAAKFGGPQKAFAETWTKDALEAGTSSGKLMEQTLALFDSCEVTEDGKVRAPSDLEGPPVTFLTHLPDSHALT